MIAKKALEFSHFQQITIAVQDRVAYVDLNNPPVNILGAKLIAELRLAAEALDHDPLVRVIVFRSSVPVESGKKSGVLSGSEQGRYGLKERM